MSIDKIINILVTVTLIQMMATIGMGVTVDQVLSVARSGRTLVGAVIANYVLVPAFAVAMISDISPSALVGAGLLITAVCPGAPYGPPFTGMAKGNVPNAVGLMVLLSMSSALLAPWILSLLLPLTSGQEKLNIDTMKMIQTLIVTQLVPLAVGIWLRTRHPLLAQRLENPAKKLSLLLNLFAFGFILYVKFHLLESIGRNELMAIVALAVASVAAGWISGTNGPGERTAMAFSTAVRNVGVSLVIVTTSFPDTPAVTAALVFAISQTIFLAILAFAWGGVAGHSVNSAYRN